MSDEDSRTLFIGNLANGVTEDILYELFLQVGPVDNVKIPMDKISKQPKNFGFVCYKNEVSVPYAFYLFSGIKLHGRNINVQTRRNTTPVPPVATVGVHSLDPEFGKEDLKNFPSSLASPNHRQMNYQPQPLMQSPYHIPLMQAPGSPLMSTPPLMNLNYMSYNNGFHSFGTTPPPAVNTNCINNFKNMHDNNYSPSYGGNQRNYGNNYQDDRHGGGYRNGRQDSPQSNYRSERTTGNSHHNDYRSSNYGSGRYDAQDGYRGRHNSQQHDPSSRRQNDSRNSREQDSYRNKSNDSYNRSRSRDDYNSRDGNNSNSYGHNRY